MTDDAFDMPPPLGSQGSISACGVSATASTAGTTGLESRFQRTAPVVRSGAAGRERMTLDAAVIRQLRHARLMSQQDLAYDCERRHIRLTISTIKRVETGSAVSLRTVRELCRCFDVPADKLIRKP